MYQGKTVNSVHLLSGIWKLPPLSINQQSSACPVTPRLQRSCFQALSRHHGFCAFLGNLPRLIPSPPHEPSGCPHPAPSPPILLL